MSAADASLPPVAESGVLCASQDCPPFLALRVEGDSLTAG